MTRNLIIVISLVFYSVGNVFAATDVKLPEVTHSPELKIMQKLVGVWEGTEIMKGEIKKMKIEYALTSGDSAVVETLMPGEEHEMVSVYYDENGKLTMKHFCMLAAKPQLDLVSSSENELVFNFSPSNKINEEEWHMHDLTISFPEDGKMIQKWTSYKEGKPEPPTVFTATKI